MPRVREHAAERRCDAGKTRHQRTFQADLTDESTDVQRAPAAEWHCDEARWIMPALDRDERLRREDPREGVDVLEHHAARHLPRLPPGDPPARLFK